MLMVRRKYCFGIYMFIDNETGNVVYIGKDSHIDVKERINAHYRPSAYDQQQINRVVQNNPERYSPKIYCHVDNIDDLNRIEFDLINLYRPKFNYKHGGQGCFIDRDFQYTVAKNGFKDGKQGYVIKTMFRKDLIQSVHKDYLDDICLKLNNGELTPDDVRNMERTVVQTLETKLKRSKATNSSGFYRIRKDFDKTCKQGFLWTYEYYDENKKHKRIKRVNLFDLKKEIMSRKMPWRIIDIDKAVQTVRSIHIGF